MISELNRMLYDAKSQNYRPVRWEMTDFFASLIWAEVEMSCNSIATGDAPIANMLLGLPIEIVSGKVPDVTLVSVDTTRQDGA